MAEGTQYRFEPLDRRGVLLGLGPGQLAVLVMAVLMAVVMVSTWHGMAGPGAAVLTLTGAAALCRPVLGRTPAHWLALGLLFAGRRRTTTQHPPGHVTPLGAPVPATSTGSAARSSTMRLPARTFADGVWVGEVAETAEGAGLGALLDERAGTATALLRARGGPFCLLDSADKARRLAAWSSVLESIAGPGSSVVRLQWCQLSVPASSARLLAHLRSAGRLESPALAGHAALVEKAGPGAVRHETLLAVVVACRGRRGRLHQEGAAALRNEVRSFRARMQSAGLVCEGVLDGPAVGRALGDYLVRGLPEAPGAHPWPLAFDEKWSAVRAGPLWHRTYWVAEWPRSQVGPDFLSPLLMGQGHRSFSVVMAPVPPDRAARDAESWRTAQMADAQLRAQGGFLETARHRRAAEAVEGREALLAEGRAAFSFSGYVTVSAGDRAGLEKASSELERSAAAARLCLRALYGQQREALLWALPLGRGL